MIAAGIGCRKGIDAVTILGVLEEALAACGRAGSIPQVLATGGLKAGETGLLELAERLGLPLTVISDAALQDASPRTLTLSRHSMAHTGVPSLCEAAALAAAGASARLAGPRHVSNGVTCAIAFSGEPT